MLEPPRPKARSLLITESLLTAWCTPLKVPLDNVLASRSHLRIASHHFLDKYFVTTW